MPEMAGGDPDGLRPPRDSQCTLNAQIGVGPCGLTQGKFSHRIAGQTLHQDASLPFACTACPRIREPVDLLTMRHFHHLWRRLEMYGNQWITVSDKASAQIKLAGAG